MQRHYFTDKGPSSQSYGFPVVMYTCESWTIRKAECWAITKAESWSTSAFELWCWRRLLRVPWTARRSNQSILKGISPVCSLEGLMLTLKLQYFGHLMWRVDSLEKTLMLGGIGYRRRRGWQRMRWLDGDSMHMELVMDRESWRTAIHGATKSLIRLSNWTDWLTICMSLFLDSLFCSFGLCVCFYDNTVMFWLLYLCSTCWNQEVWCF